MQTVDATPRAALLVESMRDVGYSLPSALADIIDNSIAASAREIAILADVAGKYIAVVDDGCGMHQAELFEIMRPGSRGHAASGGSVDLGRFGLGLKSASFSQCRRLTVVTKQKGVASAACWDLDFVIREDRWLLRIPEHPENLPGVASLGANGTVVLWEVLDRIGEGHQGEAAVAEFTAVVDESRERLGLVFHRYLAGDRGVKKVTLTLNGRPIEPYDPFHQAHRLTMKSPEEPIGNGDQRVLLQAFTLPHHRALTPKEWEYQGGPAGHLRNQGFYLYRQRRLIINGTWFGLTRMSELTKLCRVRIDIGTKQDHEWKIDIKKASAQPPAPVKRRLRELVESIAQPSRRIYTRRAARLATSAVLPVWLREQDHGRIQYLVNAEHPMVEKLSRDLAATPRQHLGELLALLGAALPVDMLFADVSEDPLAMEGGFLGDDSLQFVVHTTARQLLEAGMSPADVLRAMEVSEPFRSRWERTRKVLEEVTGMSDD